MHFGQCLVGAAQFVLRIGRAQPRLIALRATGHAVIPVDRFLVALEVLGDLAQQQALGRIRLGRLPGEFGIQGQQAGVVLLLGQQRGAHAVGLHILRANRQHALGRSRLAHQVVRDRHCVAQLGVLRGLGLHPLQQGQRLIGLAGLVELTGVQQGHARLIREALDHLIHHAPGQLGLLHAHGQAAELLPDLQAVGDGIGIHQLAQHLGRNLGIAAAADQGADRELPGGRVRVLEQRLQFGAGGLHLVLAHVQRGGAAAHGQ
ncbi:hypothetical protein D3C71_1308030 [compost metagenome]